MDFDRQLIFFFSALGAFNGFLLTFYILLKSKRQASNIFLALLILSLSVRITKSVFYYFSTQLYGPFMQIGLTACALIGPFLFLYTRTQVNRSIKKWYLHVLPYLSVMILLSILFPYWEHRSGSGVWSPYFVDLIYLQWLIYIVASFILYFPSLKFVWSNWKSLKAKDTWNLSLLIGVSIILVAYISSMYTSYIVGALSFSFILYLVILLVILRKTKDVFDHVSGEKYLKKILATDTIQLIDENLHLIQQKELFKDSEIKMPDIAKELGVSPHHLSQYLNHNLGKSFSLFINEYRVEYAKKLLKSDTPYTIEAIGYESGFKSKSTFFTAFKKLTGTTPSTYMK